MHAEPLSIIDSTTISNVEAQALPTTISPGGDVHVLTGDIHRTSFSDSAGHDWENI